MSVLIPISFILKFIDKYNIIILEATTYGIDGPISWAIKKNGFCLNKNSKFFEYEPLPSSRTEIYYRNHRFPTKEEAFEFYNKNENKILKHIGVVV
jgi:hypothetical protein